MTPTNIDIVIQKKSGNRGRRQPSRGPLERRRDPEYLPRRKSGIFVKFFDLGQYSDGAGGWIENTPTLTPTTSYTAAGASRGLVHTIGLPDWAAFTANPMSIESDVDNWESTFRPLTYEEAEMYGVDVLIDGTQYAAARDGSRTYMGTSTSVTGSLWTTKGLRLPPSDTFELVTNRLFYRIKPDNVRCKVTTTFDSSAPEASFILNSSCKVFMMPCLYFWRGMSRRQYVSSGNRTDEDVHNYVYKAVPRDVFLVNSTLQAYWGTFPMCLRPGLPDQGTIPSTASPSVRNVFKTAHATISGARENLVLVNDSTNTITSDTSLPPSSFPASGEPSGDFAGSPQVHWNLSDNGDLPDISPATNALVAVIKKGSTWYYVWGKQAGVGGGFNLSVSV